MISSKEKKVEDKYWRLLSVAPNSERPVAAQIEQNKLSAYYPIEKVYVGTGGRRRPHERPLIRSYVFAHVSEHDVPLVAHIAGVRQLIGAHSERIVVPTAFVEALQSAEAAGVYDRTRPTSKLRAGQAVNIVRGPFQGIAATIVKLTGKRRAQIVLAVSTGWKGGMSIDLAKLEAA